jgi:hypothetical protein
MFFELVAEAAEAKRCVFKLSAASCQGSGAALPFDCFDCAPERGNFLQTPAAWPFAMFSHKGQGLHPFRKHRCQSRLNSQTVNGFLSAEYRQFIGNSRAVHERILAATGKPKCKSRSTGNDHEP